MRARIFDTLTLSGGSAVAILRMMDRSLFQAAGQYLPVMRPGFANCQSVDPGLLCH